MTNAELYEKLSRLPKTGEGRNQAQEIVLEALPTLSKMREYLNERELGKAGSREYAIDSIVSDAVISDYMLLCDAIIQFKRE